MKRINRLFLGFTAIFCLFTVLFSVLSCRLSPLSETKRGNSVVVLDDDSDRVNINIASAEELQTLYGIGPVKAEAIIAYREQNGFFISAEELINVSGIGEKTYLKIKDSICVGEIHILSK